MNNLGPYQWTPYRILDDAKQEAMVRYLEVMKSAGQLDGVTDGVVLLYATQKANIAASTYVSRELKHSKREVCASSIGFEMDQVPENCPQLSRFVARKR